MINPTGKKLQDLVSKMIDDEIEGVDKYTLNGSTWLIFTDQKRWVIEYTEDNILWYNYSFFTEIFDILSMKSTDSQNLIQEWFESRFLRPTVNETRHYRHNEKSMVEHTIQNGVKDTSFVNPYFNQNVEETIQNGVKETCSLTPGLVSDVEDTIQNGVKHTFSSAVESWVLVEDTIQNGVKTKAALESHEGFMKGTPWVDKFFSKEDVEDTIQNGVKEMKEVSELSLVSEIFKVNCKKAIQNGVKQTNPMDEWVNSHNIISDVMDYGNIEMVGTGHATDNEMNDVIENGVKEIGHKKTPDESFTNHIIEDGVKEVRTDDGYVNHFRQNYKFNNVFEDIVKEVQSDCSNNTERVNGVIRVGEKLN